MVLTTRKMNLAKSLSLLLLLVTPTAGIAPGHLRGEKERELQESCNIKVSLACRVRENGIFGESVKCTSLNLKDPEGPKLETDCMQTPETVTFLYRGGDCSQTTNADSLGITCQDSNMSPPTVPGQKSYITVKSATKKGTRDTYFGAYVRVGSEFTIHDGGKVLDSGFNIRIYDNASYQRNLLQEVYYNRTLCSDEDELYNRFGACELIGYGKDYVAFGIVGSKAIAFGDVQYEVTFSLMEGAMSTDSVSLKNVTMLTTFAGNVDLTDTVKDRVVTPLQSVTVPIPHGVDLSAMEPDTMVAIVQGTQNMKGGQACSSAEFVMI